MEEAQVVDIMDQALRAELGVKVKVNNPNQLLDQFYLQRKHARDAGLDVYDDLSFRVRTGEVWIIKDGRRQANGKGGSQAVRIGP